MARLEQLSEPYIPYLKEEDNNDFSLLRELEIEEKLSAIF